MDEPRRSFLKTTALGAAATAITTAVTSRRVQGAATSVQLALIGCGGRGTSLASEFAKLENVAFRYVCDPDTRRAASAARQLPQEVTPVADLRIALDDPAVDAVIVATPDHWHTPASLLALSAGKHVYVEKPCSHNLREGRLLVEAARSAQRLVQHGTQSRSLPLVMHAIQLLREGVIGEVRAAKAWNVQQRSSIGRARPGEPPAGVDYDLWVGPAPMVPFRANCFHYSWHWWYHFGTGDMGNDGVHELDIARWGLGAGMHPARIAGLGSKLAFEDDQQFPDTQYVVFEYADDPQSATRQQLTYEMRLWSRYGMDGIDNGNAFYGSDGWMLLSKRGVLQAFDARNRPREIPQQLPTVSSHFQNFIDAVRGDDVLRAPIEEGHLSASLCHLGNIATRVQRTLRFDPASERILEDQQAGELLTREYRSGHFASPPA